MMRGENLIPHGSAQKSLNALPNSPFSIHFSTKKTFHKLTYYLHFSKTN